MTGKTKRIAAGLAVALVVGLTIMLVVHHLRQYKGRTHFPKSTWVFAGFGDPVSALETACWTVAHGDGKTMLASLAPEMRQLLEEVWKQKGKAKGLSLEEYFVSSSRTPFNEVLGFRVLGLQKVNDLEARVRVYVQGWWAKETIQMKKDGDEWKVAGFSDP